MSDIDQLDALFQGIDFENDPAGAQQKWNDFLNALLGGVKLRTVTTDGPYGVALFARPGQEQQLMAFAFTNLDEARRAQMDESQLGLASFTDFSAVVKALPLMAGVLVNPATKALMISREIIGDMDRFLTSNHTEQTLQRDTQVLIGDPANHPQALVDDLAREAARHGAIERLWLRQMSARGEQSYLVVIDMPAHDRQVVESLGAVVNMHPDLGQPVDFVVRNELGDSFAPPFYVRANAAG